MQKTVGMITIYHKNYGAFLQAYALQQVLLSHGCQPEIIRYDYYRDRAIMGVGLHTAKRPVRFLKMLAVEILRYRVHQQRGKVFDESIARHMLESKEYYRTYRSLKKHPPQYDLYITGSDQVFNPTLSRQALDARLLRFVQSGKRMSYAASAGGDCIPIEFLERFRDALKDFEAVSVREQGLRDFMAEKLKVNAVRNVDPTLLLTKEQWKAFAQPCQPKQDYIFYYRISKQEAVEQKARELSRRLNLPIFVADGNDTFPNQMERKAFLSPEEWVGMMAQARYVVTNSFHGAAFAINLEKRASIVIPTGGGVRLSDLLKQCHLEDEMTKEIMSEDTDTVYAEARQYLAKERERASNLIGSIIEETVV